MPRTSLWICHRATTRLVLAGLDLQTGAESLRLVYRHPTRMTRFAMLCRCLKGPWSILSVASGKGLKKQWRSWTCQNLNPLKRVCSCNLPRGLKECPLGLRAAWSRLFIPTPLYAVHTELTVLNPLWHNRCTRLLAGISAREGGLLFMREQAT